MKNPAIPEELSLKIKSPGIPEDSYKPPKDIKHSRSILTGLGVPV
jgi:hypothetical protein